MSKIQMTKTKNATSGGRSIHHPCRGRPPCLPGTRKSQCTWQQQEGIFACPGFCRLTLTRGHCLDRIRTNDTIGGYQDYPSNSFKLYSGSGPSKSSGTRNSPLHNPKGRCDSTPFSLAGKVASYFSNHSRNSSNSCSGRWVMAYSIS